MCKTYQWSKPHRCITHVWSWSLYTTLKLKKHMKYILIALLSILSLTTYSKGGGGGHSSSSHSSASHSSAHESSHGTSEAPHSSYQSHSVSSTHFNVYPNGVYWVVVHNNHLNQYDTLTAKSSDELAQKIVDNNNDPLLYPVILSFVIIGFCIFIYLIYMIFKVD